MKRCRSLFGGGHHPIYVHIRETGLLQSLYGVRREESGVRQWKMFSERGKVVSVAENIDTIAEKMVFVAEGIFSVAEKIFSMTKTIFSASEKIFSMAGTMFSAREKIFSMAGTFFSGTENIFSASKKMFSKAIPSSPS